MAVAFSSPLDLGKLELLNARIQNLASAPSSPVEGQIYHNTTDHKIYGYSGSVWVDMFSQGTTYTGGTGINVSGSVVSLATGGIANTHIGASAAIALSKLASGSSAQVIVGDGSGVPTYRSVTGDVTIGNTGVTALGAGVVVDADVNASAAIAQSKIASLVSDLAAKAPLASPALTGNPTAPTPTAGDNDTSIATTAFVSAALALAQQGIDFKNSVRAATTANIATATALNSGDVIDGVTLANGDRVLVKDQTTKSENGIWVVAATPIRAVDADAAGELSGGSFVFVEEGTANADTGWVIITNGLITPGTTNHDWTIFSRAGELTAGDGLSKTGAVLAVDSTVARRNADNTISGNVIASKAATGLNPVVSGITSASGRGVYGESGGGNGVRGVATGGTAAAIAAVHEGAGYGVEAGSDSGTAFKVSVSNHGSGPAMDASWFPIVHVPDGVDPGDVATIGQLNAAIPASYNELIGDGSTTSIVMTHNLNSRKIKVTARRVASPYDEVLVENQATTLNTATLVFGTAPTTDQFDVTIEKIA